MAVATWKMPQDLESFVARIMFNGSPASRERALGTSGPLGRRLLHFAASDLVDAVAMFEEALRTKQELPRGQPVRPHEMMFRYFSPQLAQQVDVPDPATGRAPLAMLCGLPHCPPFKDQQVKFVKLLLEAWANPNCDSGLPLRLAVANGSVQVAELLMDYNASPNYVPPSSPVQVAAAAGQAPAASQLQAASQSSQPQAASQSQVASQSRTPPGRPPTPPVPAGEAAAPTAAPAAAAKAPPVIPSPPQPAGPPPPELLAKAAAKHAAKQAAKAGPPAAPPIGSVQPPVAILPPLAEQVPASPPVSPPLAEQLPLSLQVSPPLAEQQVSPPLAEQLPVSVSPPLAEQQLAQAAATAAWQDEPPSWRAAWTASADEWARASWRWGEWAASSWGEWAASRSGNSWAMVPAAAASRPTPTPTATWDEAWRGWVIAPHPRQQSRSGRWAYNAPLNVYVYFNWE